LVEFSVNSIHAAKKAKVKDIIRSSALTADENATTIPNGIGNWKSKSAANDSMSKMGMPQWLVCEIPTDILLSLK